MSSILPQSLRIYSINKNASFWLLYFSLLGFPHRRVTRSSCCQFSCPVRLNYKCSTSPSPLKAENSIARLLVPVLKACVKCVEWHDISQKNMPPYAVRRDYSMSEVDLPSDQLSPKKKKKNIKQQNTLSSIHLQFNSHPVLFSLAVQSPSPFNRNLCNDRG